MIFYFAVQIIFDTFNSFDITSSFKCSASDTKGAMEISKFAYLVPTSVCLEQVSAQ